LPPGSGLIQSPGFGRTVAVATQIGRVIAGKYRLERTLATGGMGTVVAATHLQLGRTVALKFMRANLLDNAEAIARFTREARAAATLRSEHVAQVMDVEVDPEDGAPYIVMEYLEGRDLASILATKDLPPVANTVGYVLQACEGLAEAHAKGIVHRDLKPANLFLTRRPDGTPLVKVLDFGVSKLNEAAQSGSFHLSQPQKALGSPLYMSPEQMIASPHVDHRADIWALGVILYELLSGQPPFDAATFLELGLAVTNSPHPPLLGRAPGLAPGLVAVVDRCLQKTAAARFSDLATLATALVPHARPAADASAARIAGTLGLRAQAPRPRPRRAWRAVALGAIAVGLAAGLVAMIGRPAAVVRPERAPAPVVTPRPTVVAVPVAPPQPAPAPAPEPANRTASASVPDPARSPVDVGARHRHRASAPGTPSVPARTPTRTADPRDGEQGTTRTRRGPVVTDF
jgi:serine/threonine-protein kinase